MSNYKIIEIKDNRDQTVLIPKENISYIIGGGHGINYIYLKDKTYAIETTEYISSLKAKFES